MNTSMKLTPSSAPRCRGEAGCMKATLVSTRQTRQFALTRRSAIGARLQARSPVVTRCTAETDVKAAASTPPSEQKEEYIETILEKPLGLRFARGRDGAAYVTVNDAKLGNTLEEIQPGDKIVEVSASFGAETWEAKNFGQVMFAIRTRNGGVFLKFKKMYGDMTMLEEEETTEAEKMWRKERAGGNVGLGTREIQRRNYIEKKEKEEERMELFNGALSKFKRGEVESALIDFENVIALEPKNYMGDNFSRVTEIYMYAQYNAACCYSSLGQIDAGLESLETALNAGFDDYQKVRSDANLSKLRESEDFKPLINKYDEPIINEEAVNMLKNMFSFGKKDN